VIPTTNDHGEPRDWRSLQNVQCEIDKHIAARREYAQAAAWAAQAEAENLPAAVVEAARDKAAKVFEEMNWLGRRLMITMPTDPKGLVDLLMYLERRTSLSSRRRRWADRLRSTSCTLCASRCAR
jgi:hypothetical protein